MRYYTAIIPLPIAEKLKEKGMPMQDAYTPILYDKPESVMSGCVIPTYAACFDWFLDKHEAFVYVTSLRMDEGWQYCGGIWGFGIDLTLGWKKSWHEAANAAIEKALNLI